MANKILKLFYALTIAAVAVIVLLGSLIPKAAGWIPLAMTSGSMTGTINAGDLVIVKPLEGEARASAQVGDIVSFYPRPDTLEGLTTHRVIDRQVDAKGEVTYITKGDANAAPDAAIMAKQVAAVEVYTLPKLGYVAAAMDDGGREVVGTALAVGLIGYGAFVGGSKLKGHRLRKRETSSAHGTERVGDTGETSQGDHHEDH